MIIELHGKARKVGTHFLAWGQVGNCGHHPRASKPNERDQFRLEDGMRMPSEDGSGDGVTITWTSENLSLNGSYEGALHLTAEELILMTREATRDWPSNKLLAALAEADQEIAHLFGANDLDDLADFEGGDEQ